MRKILVLLPALVLAAGCAAPAGKSSAVQVAVTDNGFEPGIVTVEKGQSLVITRKVEATCATEAVFKTGGKSYPLPLNVPVTIPIEAASGETLRYACAMDMFHGAVVVK